LLGVAELCKSALYLLTYTCHRAYDDLLANTENTRLTEMHVYSWLTNGDVLGRDAL